MFKKIVFMLAFLAMAGCKQETAVNTNAVEKTKPLGGSPYKAHLIFTGICTFVHHNGLNQTVAEIPTHDMNMNSDDGEPIHAHRAFLVIDTSKFAVKPALGVRPEMYGPNGKYAIFWLTDAELSLWDTSKNGSWTQYKSCPYASDVKDVNVVPHIGEHCSASASNVVPLEATVRLSGPTEGTITPYVASNDLYKFATKAVHDQDPLLQGVDPVRIAQIIDWSFPLPLEEPLVLYRAKPSVSPVREPFLTIERINKTDPDVAIVLGSAPEDELKDALDSKTSSAQPGRPDYHFEIYYDRCSPRKPKHQKPIPYYSTTVAGCAEQRPPWMPDWAWPDVTQTQPLHAVGTLAITSTVAPSGIVGGVNCGPDQVP